MTHKKQYIIVAVVLAIIAVIAYWQYTKSQDNQAAAEAEMQTVANEEFGLSFSYPSGESGFTLVEPPSNRPNLNKAYIMIPTKEYADFQTAEAGGETPAGMNVFVFTLEDIEVAEGAEKPERITRLQNWAVDNTAITSFNLAQNTPDIVEIDGLKALHYKAGGLYQQDIYLASYRGLVYMFVGQFNEETDQTYTAFQSLMASVSFN